MWLRFLRPWDRRLRYRLHLWCSVPLRRWLHMTVVTVLNHSLQGQVAVVSYRLDIMLPSNVEGLVLSRLRCRNEKEHMQMRMLKIL
ncbi:hypothetical protein DPMN_110116 [Dreissena polymorpha]|uniref:Uncharacterized protein n=1 Tax=Dreissena polymorpha TaxID=45954 RepID=A0A9D4KCJ3_DREPO|nr:hypothetical protein DPMN_110116 [Dreissena polymorpha]